jgi:D-amino peptidase
MMKFFISTDLEGVAVVTGVAGQGLSKDCKQYEFARKMLTAETNAAIDGLLSAGDVEIIVEDGHGDGTSNLIYDELRRGVKILSGVPRPRRLTIMDESFAGVLLIGFHPMAGVAEGVLSHSFSSVAIQNMWLNGRPVGEIGLTAVQAGSLGVPVIFVSSCKAGAQEAKDWIPGVRTVAVKEGLGRNCALSLHPEDAQEKIRDGVKRAVAKLSDIKPVRLDPPYELRVEYKLESMAESEAKATGWQRADARTIVRRSDDIFKVL